MSFSRCHKHQIPIQTQIKIVWHLQKRCNGWHTYVCAKALEESSVAHTYVCHGSQSVNKKKIAEQFFCSKELKEKATGQIFYLGENGLS